MTNVAVEYGAECTVTNKKFKLCIPIGGDGGWGVKVGECEPEVEM